MTEFSSHHKPTDFDVFNHQSPTINTIDIDKTVQKWSYNISGLITDALHISGSKAKADKRKEVSDSLQPIIQDIISRRIKTDTPLPTSLREWKQASFPSHEDYIDFVDQFQSDGEAPTV